MNIETLLNAVTEISGTPRSQAPTQPQGPTQLHLSTPPEVMKEVRTRLKELSDADKADLRDQIKELEEKLRGEKLIIAEAESSVESLMAQGMDRDEIVRRRAESSVAYELAEKLELELDGIEDKIAKIEKHHGMLRTRCVKNLEGLEVTVRSYLIDYATGGNAHRLNPDRSVRSYRDLLNRETHVKEFLNDDDLAHRALLACGTFEVPGGAVVNAWDAVWAVMPDRYKEEFEGNQPEDVLKRLNKKAKTKKGDK